MGYTQELTFWDWICCACDKRNIRSGDDVDFCTRCWHQRDCCCTGKVPEPEPEAGQTNTEGDTRRDVEQGKEEK